MTFKEIYKEAIKTLALQEGDIYIDSIIKGAINRCYLDLSKIEPTLKNVTVTAIGGIVALPNDFDSIEIISPSLKNGEYRKGHNLLVYSNADGTQKSFDVTYVAVPTKLTNDSDVPLLSNKAQMLINNYVCADYFTSQGKLTEAQYYSALYEKAKKKLNATDNVESTIQDTTGGW